MAVEQVLGQHHRCTNSFEFDSSIRKKVGTLYTYFKLLQYITSFGVEELAVICALEWKFSQKNIVGRSFELAEVSCFILDQNEVNWMLFQIIRCLSTLKIRTKKENKIIFSDNSNQLHD